MKNYTLIFAALFLTLTSISRAQTTPVPAPIQVEEQDAIFLFRYVGGAFTSLPEDLENQILHSELMMCSLLFKMGNKKTARCLLPSEQVKFDKDNAAQVFEIMKKYGMPSHFKFGYETLEGGLDCSNALSGKDFPKCFLTPKTLEPL